jgi:peptide/nickel transport system substrate-binding protein
VRRRWIAAAFLVLAIGVVQPAAGTPVQTPKRGGTVVVGTLREPGCLNAFLLRCHGNIPPAGHIMSLVLRGAFAIGPGFTWRPDLVTSVDVTRRAPFTLTYHIRPEARWSDGVPITARDFAFTFSTLRTLPEVDREPLHLDFVRSVRQVDVKTVRVILRSRLAGWHGLFSTVLPHHALRGEDFSAVWQDRLHDPKTGRAIGSGPFVVGSWERGRSLTFVRNARYWGPHQAYVDRIVLRFCRACSEGSELVTWLRTGELDLVMALGVPEDFVQEVRRLPGVRVRVAPGPLWEHIDIRVERGGHPALERKGVRRALLYGIDRAAIARIYGAESEPSQSAIFLSSSPRYRPVWRRYGFRPAEARRLLEQEGCRRGTDGVYVCGGERLSLRFVTTAGAGSPRERTLRLVQSQLGQVGIEVRPVFAPSNLLFNQILTSGEFELILFNWIKTYPDSDLDSHDLYGCDGNQNYSGYCQRLVTKDLDQVRRVLDPAQQARVLRRADAQLARDAPVIPLVERPLLAAFRPSLRNVDLATGAWNPFQNAENWWLDR